MVKNPPANEESTGDTDSTPGAGRFPEEEMATHSGVPACRTPWTEEPGGLQSMGSQRVGHDSATSMHTCNFILKCDKYISPFLYLK